MLKVHGSKNTFYLLGQCEFNTLKLKGVNIKEYVRALCSDGTDGVLFEEGSQSALSKMRIFNGDGSEAEMCGNGLRCFARYILEKHKLKSASIETMQKTYQVDYLEDFFGQVGITICLTSIKDWPSDELIKYNGLSLGEFRAYNVSNPHIVHRVNTSLSKKDLVILGKKAQTFFLSGVNVNIYQVLDPCNIYVRTFERGVGITPACGTGMTASAVDYAKSFKLFDKVINVFSDGGLVSIKVKLSLDGYDAQFTGNATIIGEEIGKDDFKVFPDEMIKYDIFYKKTRAMIHKYKI